MDLYSHCTQLMRDFEENFRPMDNKNLEESRSMEKKLVKKPSVSKKPDKKGGVMTNAEKNELTKKIKSLPKNDLRGILSIIKDHVPPKQGGVVEFDLMRLPNHVCYRIQDYVHDRLRAMQTQATGDYQIYQPPQMND